MDTSKSRNMDIDMPPIKVPSNLPSNTKVPIKIDTVLWLILAAITVYYSEIISVLKTEDITSRTSFTLALGFGTISVGIAIYLIVWCTYIKGISTDNWEAHNPYAIPVATAFGVLSGICWNIALWNVYGIKTPLITLTICMGFVMLVSLLPSGSSVERSNPRQALTNSKWTKVE